MVNDFVKVLKKFKVIYYLGKQIMKIKYFLNYYILFNIKKFLRVKEINKKNPYEKLKTLKNKHRGERCFIIGTGPSLAIPDLEKLKNEVTISMNSICLAFDETSWRPTYYGIQDPDVYLRMEEHIDKLCVKGKFISSLLANMVQRTDDLYIYPINYLNHLTSHKKYQSKFSDDTFAVVYSGYSITYSLLQIAVYMGFDEIYLLGIDCNYSSNMKHHFKEYGYVDPQYLSLGNMQTKAFMVAKEYADKNNVKIFNATRGGMLEVFERVDLDEVLSESNKSCPEALSM